MHKQGDTKGHGSHQRLGRARKDPLQKASEGVCFGHTLLQTFRLQTVRAYVPVVQKHPICGHLLQQLREPSTCTSNQRFRMHASIHCMSIYELTLYTMVTLRQEAMLIKHTLQLEIENEVINIKILRISNTEVFLHLHSSSYPPPMCAHCPL